MSTTRQSGGASAAPLSRDEPTVGDEVNDALRTLLPWVTSLVFHLGVILLAVFAAWSYVIVDPPPASSTPTVNWTPRATGDLTQAPQPDLGGEKGVRTVEPEKLPEPGIGEETLVVNPVDGLTDGRTGGVTNPFGKPAETQPLQMYGIKSTHPATKIVYIIDASGSLVDSLPFVIKELKRSIERLRAPQEFTVIFFQSGDAVEAPPLGLKAAEEAVRRKVIDWISLENGNIVPRGSTNPTRALQLAMSYRPDLVFLLSDNITGRGRWEVDRGQLLTMLREANPVIGADGKQRRAVINTIQFLYRDPYDTLEVIAREHGGEHRFISEADLGLRP